MCQNNNKKNNNMLMIIIIINIFFGAILQMNKPNFKSVSLFTIIIFTIITVNQNKMLFSNVFALILEEMAS